jgi:hypothetical protein
MAKCQNLSTKTTISKPALAMSGSSEWIQFKDLLTPVETALVMDT